MIPYGFHRVLSRALIYQHCRGHDPDLLRSLPDTPVYWAVWCPVCEHTVTGPTDHEAISDWNDHCIARISAGKG